MLSLDPSPRRDWYLTSSADALVVKHPIPTPSSVVGMEAPVATAPLQVLQTKHAGQQGLRVRDDGKVFATAGWDARVRVYKGAALAELAVLKWHREGCYCVAFADVSTGGGGDEVVDDGAGKEVARRVGRLTVKEERLRKARTAHWLAAGSKDGKVSLWDIY